MNSRMLWKCCENLGRLLALTRVNSEMQIPHIFKSVFNSETADQNALCGTFQDFHNTYCCYCTYIPN